MCFPPPPPLPFISQASHAIIDIDTNEYLPCIMIYAYVKLKILEYVLFFWSLIVSAEAKQFLAGCCFNAIEIYSIQTGEQSVMLGE